MGEILDARIEKASAARHLPVSEAGIPLAARFTLSFPVIEQLSSKAEADEIEREQSKSIVEEALRYTPLLVEQFQAGLLETTEFLLANGIRPKIEGKKLKDRVAQEIKPFSFSSYRDPRTEDVTRSVTREIVQTVHPDTQDASTREAIPEEWVSGWIEAAKNLQANPDYNDANRLLLESMPRYYTRLVMSMFDSGMTVDQIVHARPNLVGELERLRYIAQITKRNPQKGHISPQDAEKKAISIRREADLEARAVCGGTLYMTLDMMVDLCQQAELGTQASSLIALRESAKVGAGRMGGAAEYRKQYLIGTLEPDSARWTGQVLDERLLQIPARIKAIMASLDDTESEGFDAAVKALQGAIWNINGTAQSYNDALADDAARRAGSRRLFSNEENFPEKDRGSISKYYDKKSDLYKENKNY